MKTNPSAIRQSHSNTTASLVACMALMLAGVTATAQTSTGAMSGSMSGSMLGATLTSPANSPLNSDGRPTSYIIENLPSVPTARPQPAAPVFTQPAPTTITNTTGADYAPAPSSPNVQDPYTTIGGGNRNTTRTGTSNAVPIPNAPYTSSDPVFNNQAVPLVNPTRNKNGLPITQGDRDFQGSARNAGYWYREEIGRASCRERV